MDDEAKPMRKAKDSPWYRLATFHGEPSKRGDEIQVKNRTTWNRWMASKIPDDQRAVILETEQYTLEELTPFPEDELRSIISQTGTDIESSAVDFSDTEFDAPFFASNFIFSGDADFRGATFSGEADFRGATFGNASFASATFSGFANFASATFSGFVDFGSVTFSGAASFSSATFSSNANFGRVTFSDTTDFASATFSYAAYFGSATFSGFANFASATFSGFVDFGDATFSGNANFRGATFNDITFFRGATFIGYADFTNAEMKARTSFRDAKFSAPPRCFNTKLHEGTTWHGVQWPETPGDGIQAREFIDAYERLKLEMDRLKKHGDELDFFAREQQCRRVVLGPWKGLPIAIYGFLSDYGRSYSRPLVLLATTVLVGSFLFAVHIVGSWTSLWSDRGRQAVGISFANTLGLFGRPLMKPDALVELPDWLKAVATVQSILGIVLLFLFGLGIRNRFRMK
jgi:uncharacterized protein YjbI with pentapeptide repeats